MKTIGSVESITGGLFASTIINKPGASHYFKGALVLYAKQLKKQFGIDITNGTINEQVVKQMINLGQKKLDVDICIAFTGNAGPQKSDGEDVGKVWIAINENVWELKLNGSRTSIRQQCVDFGIKKIKELYKMPNI